MSSTRTILSLTCLSALFAACSGGGIVERQAVVPAGASKSNGTVALSVKIPAKVAPSNVRRAQYVSPSTKSLALTISHSGTPVLQEAVGLNVASNPTNCTTSAGATTCTLTFSLAPGSYLGTIATYDGAIVGGAATGNLLSQGQSLAVAVLGGQTNDLTLTLDGVPASITIVPASGSLITGTQGAGFYVPPSSPQALLLNALDIDGNTIVGPGSPTFTAQVSPSAGYTIAQPTLSTPNQITLAATGSGGSATIAVTAAPPNGGFSCSLSGVVCAASAGVVSHSHTLFLAGPSGLWVYTSPDNVTWTLVTTNTTAFGNPTSIAIAPSGALIVADSGNSPFGSIPSELDIFAAPYTGAPTVNTHVTSPYSSTVTPSGTLLLGSGSTHLDTLAAPYTGTPTSLSVPQIESFVADVNGNAILSSTGSTLQYAQPSYTQSTTVSSSLGGYIAMSTGGTLAIGNLFSTYEIGVFAPPITSSMPALIPLSGQPDGGITFDSNGNIWVALNTAHLQEFAAPFTSGESPTLDVHTGTTPNSLGADSSGDVLYFASPSVHFYNSSGVNTANVTAPSYAESMLYVK